MITCSISFRTMTLDYLVHGRLIAIAGLLIACCSDDVFVVQEDKPRDTSWETSTRDDHVMQWQTTVLLFA